MLLWNIPARPTTKTPSRPAVAKLPQRRCNCLKIASFPPENGNRCQISSRAGRFRLALGDFDARWQISPKSPRFRRALGDFVVRWQISLKSRRFYRNLGEVAKIREKTASAG
jgi:hypothetical protein